MGRVSGGRGLNIRRHMRAAGGTGHVNIRVRRPTGGNVAWLMAGGFGGISAMWVCHAAVERDRCGRPLRR